MQRTCRGGRRERAPQYFKADPQKQPTQDTADKVKGGAAEPRLVGVAFFPLLFLSRYSRPRHDLLFEMCVDSFKPPSRCHLQHDHSSLDVSEETVVICVRALYHIWTCKKERNPATECQYLSSNAAKTPRMCKRQETRTTQDQTSAHSAFSSAVYITIISKAQEPS